MQKVWASALAITIVTLTLLVFGAFGVHVLNAGEYEQRTVIAMSVRTLVWAAIAITCWQHLWWRTAK